MRQTSERTAVCTFAKSVADHKVTAGSVAALDPFDHHEACSVWVLTQHYIAGLVSRLAVGHQDDISVLECR